ncbi:DNA gyrase subunit A, partial [filamentous cyanobacterium CCP5]
GRPTRGVRAMSLRNGDELISMDILPSQVVEAVVEANASDSDDDDDASGGESGPWVLVITASGLGKRVPVAKFRLQNRAGMGLMSIKFRKRDDALAALLVVGEGDELMLVTNRGIIIRQRVGDISIQSRPATGVKLQRLDGEDAIAAVAVVPPALQVEGLDDAEASEPTEAVVEAIVEAITEPAIEASSEEE